MARFRQPEFTADEASEITRQLEQWLTQFDLAVAAIPLAPLRPTGGSAAASAAAETAVDALANEIAALRVQCENASRAIKALEVNLSHTLPRMEHARGRKLIEQLSALHQARTVAEATLHEYEQLLAECRLAVGAPSPSSTVENSGAG
jgi:hypothetical protein